MSTANLVNGIEIKLAKTEPAKKIYKVTLSDERLKETERKWLDAAKTGAKIPGFRKGTAPQEVLLKQLSPWIKEKTSEEVFSVVVKDIVEREKLRLIYNPVISRVDYQFGEKLEFEVVFSVEPKIENLIYKGLKLKKHHRAILDQEVDDELKKYIQESQSYLKPKADGKIDRDNLWVALSAKYVSADDPQTPLLDINNELVSLEEEALPFKLLDSLKSLKVGESKSYSVPCDEDCPVRSLRNKNLNLAVQVHEVKELIEPQGANPLDSQPPEKVAELKKQIREILSRRYGAREKNLLRDQATAELLDANSIEVGDEEVEERTIALLGRAKTLLAMSGHEVSRELEDELKVKYKIEALNDVCLDYILAAIARDAGIKAGEEDFKKALDQTPDPEEKKKLVQNRGAVLYEIFTGKVFDHVLSFAKIETQEL